jgi:hypothetical protein
MASSAQSAVATVFVLAFAPYGLTAEKFRRLTGTQSRRLVRDFSAAPKIAIIQQRHKSLLFN